MLLQKNILPDGTFLKGETKVFGQVSPRARANYAEKAEVANSEEINILIERESVLGMRKARS